MVTKGTSVESLTSRLSSTNDCVRQEAVDGLITIAKLGNTLPDATVAKLEEMSNDDSVSAIKGEEGLAAEAIKQHKISKAGGNNIPTILINAINARQWNSLQRLFEDRHIGYAVMDELRDQPGDIGARLLRTIKVNHVDVNGLPPLVRGVVEHLRRAELAKTLPKPAEGVRGGTPSTGFRLVR